jgi:glycosyltransferase involved in cell wall biosynthesis
MAKVSILMNGYNSEKFLQATLDSVKAQTFSDYEIIFIDNCSTDNTAKIATAFGERLKLIQTPKNIPLGEARNFGLPYCKGEFLAFLDTDDLWYPQKLERQIEQMSQNPQLVMSYTSAQWIDEEGNPLKKELVSHQKEQMFAEQLKRYEINMQSVLLRQQKIRPDILSFNPTLSFSPDFNLFMKIVALYPAEALPQTLVAYRVVAGSLTKRSLERWGDEFRTTINDAVALVPEQKEHLQKAYRLAMAKADFYDARFAMKIGDYSKARKLLATNQFLTLNYFVLHLLSYAPTIWQKVFKDV